MSDLNEAIHLSYVFIGHPRCGSAALAAGLRNAGLDIHHERPGNDGIVSWWLTGFYRQKTNGIHEFSPSRKGAVPIIADKVLSYIRKPSDALPSIMVENEFQDRDNNSFRHRHRIIRKHFDVDLAELDELNAAVASYVFWNRLADRIADADLPIKVEKPDFGLVQPGLHADNLPVRNTTEKKYGVKKKTLDLKSLQSKIPSEHFEYLSSMEEQYLDSEARPKP